jgi:hypothetical protein
MQSFESSSESGLYYEWLRDRGLSETSAAETAGVFLRDISLESSTLLVSNVVPESATQDVELLKRLGAAIGSQVSIVAVSKESMVPWSLLFHLLPHLKQLVLLGDDIQDQLKRSGSGQYWPAEAVITGAAPHILSQDVSEKRTLWQKIQQRFH